MRAAWRHHTARDAVEVVDLEPLPRGWRLRGTVTGVEAGTAFAAQYDVDVDAAWVTQRAVVTPVLGGESVRLARAPGGRWSVDGRERPDLDGLVDVDLECSVVTNTVAVHRLGLHEAGRAGRSHAADAAYVGLDGRVDRLAQTYGPVVATPGAGTAVEYAAPSFDVACRLVLDEDGLVVDYPGLATRLL